MDGGILLVSAKVFGLLPLDFILGGLKIFRGDFFFPFEGSFLSSILIFTLWTSS